MLKDILRLLHRDNLQVQALQECCEMAEMCRLMVRESVDSLRNRDDAEIRIDIFDMDQKLNAFERDVRRKVMTHLSLGNAADIASGLTLVSIVIDLERIGDYSKNIYDLARNHPTRLVAGDLERLLGPTEKLILTHFDQSMQAFCAGDEDASRRLMAEYKDEIAADCREIETALLAGKAAVTAPEAVAIALYTRFLRRIAAHSRNLVSSLVNPFDRIGYRP